MRLSPFQRVCIAATIPVVLLFIGAACYRLIEGPEWTFNDAMYMSAITLTTVGYGETRPLSPAGRWFTIVFLFVGVFTLFFTATEIIRAIVNGQIRQLLGRERMERTLQGIKNHVIVCGLGRMGRLVCQTFEKQEVPFVVVDRDSAVLADVSFTHGVTLHGDATSDEILQHAGIDRARALVAALPSDADNLFIVLSTRVLSDKIAIVARAEEEGAVAKLRRVGANHVVAPYSIGGHRAVQAVLKPTVSHFLDMAGRHDVDYVVEELLIEAGSSLCGVQLEDTRLHEEYGVVVLSIKTLTGDLVYNPQRDHKLEAGQVLVVVGHRGQMSQVKRRGRAEAI